MHSMVCGPAHDLNQCCDVLMSDLRFVDPSVATYPAVSQVPRFRMMARAVLYRPNSKNGLGACKTSGWTLRLSKCAELLTSVWWGAISLFLPQKCGLLNEPYLTMHSGGCRFEGSKEEDKAQLRSAVMLQCTAWWSIMPIKSSDDNTHMPTHVCLQRCSETMPNIQRYTQTLQHTIDKSSMRFTLPRYTLREHCLSKAEEITLQSGLPFHWDMSEASTQKQNSSPVGRPLLHM